MIEMRIRICQDLTFFFLALLLLVCGSCSAAQYINEAALQMDEISGFQMDGNSPSQIASASVPQAGGFSESQTGERLRSQMGGKKRFPLNASSGSISTGAHASDSGAGRGNADVDIQNWRGTASKDGESHPVRLNIETISALNPDMTRNLLSSNLSLEDIRSQLSTDSKNAILRGSLRIRSDSYHLVNITVEPFGNESVLQAGLAGPGSICGTEDIAGVVGYMSVTISSDDPEAARGYAVIDESGYHGAYDLELKRQSGRGHMWGMLGRPSGN